MWNMRFGTVAASTFNAQPRTEKKKRKFLEWTTFFKPMSERKAKQKTLAEFQADFMKSHEALQGGALRK